MEGGEVGNAPPEETIALTGVGFAEAWVEEPSFLVSLAFVDSHFHPVLPSTLLYAK